MDKRPEKIFHQRKYWQISTRKMFNNICYQKNANENHNVTVLNIYCCGSVTKSCPTLLQPPWTVTHQAPLSMGFYRREYCSGLPFPSLRDLPNPGIKPGSPALASLIANQQRVCLQCRRPGFNSWVAKIPWRRKWQSTPILLPGKSHGERILTGYSLWGQKSWTWLSG